MASQKTLMDLFQPAKRLKLSPSPSGSSSSKPLRFDAKLSSLSDSSSSALTPDQEFRVEFNKLRAKSKRNLKICLDNLSKAKREGVGYVKLEELLVEQTWSEALSGELQKPYAKNLCKFVEREICGGNVPIYPPHHLIFNALNSTPFDRVKAVIIGQDPYHGPGQAMGLSFSVPEGVKVPSSLVNIFKELQKDLGCSIPSNGNLERWAIQGVLLLNTVLTAEKQVTEISTELVPWWHLDVTEIERETVHIFFKDVRQHQANSHAKKGWEQFTDAVIKTISREKEGVIFLLWGNSAQEKSRLIDGNKHHILKAAHPSGLSANRGFFGCRHFSRANKLLEQMGILPIDWQL